MNSQPIRVFKVTGSYIDGHTWTLESLEDLARFFLANRKLPPQIYIIDTWDGCELTIGYGGPVGCVQHSKNHLPPYRVILGDHPDAIDYLEFDSGGTPTPIHRKFLLPFERVEAIVTHYFLHGELPDDAGWEEI